MVQILIKKYAIILSYYTDVWTFLPLIIKKKKYLQFCMILGANSLWEL